MEDDCADCPTSLATAGTGYPSCVVYDTETVFGGLGFKEGVGNIKYLAHGDFQDPCGGQAGSFIIRSPARRTDIGCGNIIFSTREAQCSAELAIQDTFSKLFLLSDLVLAEHDVGRKVSGSPWTPGSHSSPWIKKYKRLTPNPRGLRSKFPCPPGSKELSASRRSINAPVEHSKAAMVSERTPARLARRS